ncbi:MAG: DUF362 domain-containing protein [Armatimonadetes bacterium]|nr:DUF362 domain-containing protein [Armatimonadota bacterium]
MKAHVAIWQADVSRVEEQVGALLSSLGIDGSLRGQPVVVKPNLVTDVPRYIEAGANTDPRVIAGALAWLRDAGAQAYLVESETGTRLKGRRFWRVVELMRLDELAARYGAEIVNLTDSPGYRCG